MVTPFSKLKIRWREKINIKIIQFNSLLFFALLTFNAYAGFDEIVVFGDSLSDTGNIASINGSFPTPPFFESNRVSNGPVAVEGLAEKLGLRIEPSMHLVGGFSGRNYAVAGARAAGDDPIDLTTQVGTYLLHNGGDASTNSLYVMFIGGMDVRIARGLSRVDAEAALNSATLAIDQQLRLLIAAGAQHFLVVNSPNVGAIPETQLLAGVNDNKHLVKQTKKRNDSEYFNRQLAKNVKRIERDTGHDLVLFDLFSYLNKILENSNALAYTNTVDACYSTVSFSFNEGCESGQRFSKYLFFDEVHPTGRTHERISRALFAEVPEGI